MRRPKFDREICTEPLTDKDRELFGSTLHIVEGDSDTPRPMTRQELDAHVQRVTAARDIHTGEWKRSRTPFILIKVP